MIELSAGKANTKYRIYISKTALTKKVLNQNIDKDDVQNLTNKLDVKLTMTFYGKI